MGAGRTFQTRPSQKSAQCPSFTECSRTHHLDISFSQPYRVPLAGDSSHPALHCGWLHAYFISSCSYWVGFGVPAHTLQGPHLPSRCSPPCAPCLRFSEHLPTSTWNAIPHTPDLPPPGVISTTKGFPERNGACENTH